MDLNKTLDKLIRELQKIIEATNSMLITIYELSNIEEKDETRKV